MLTDVLKEVSGVLNRRFFINSLLPSLMFWGLLIVVWFAGKGELSEAFNRWSRQEVIIKVLQVFSFLGWVLLFSNVVASNSQTILRFYEGYWDFPIGKFFHRLGKSWHKQRLEYLGKAVENDPNLYEEIYLGYPLPTDLDEVMPTRLGNILKNAELYPKDRYEIDAVLIWPRLYHLLPQDFTKVISGLRSSLDAMLLCTSLAIAFAVLTGVYLLVVGASWWLFLVCFGGGMLVALTAYQGALGNTWVYAQQIKAAYDLYRNDLLVKMGLRLPGRRDKEKKLWRDLCDLLYASELSDDAKLDYQTVEASPEKDP